MYCLGSKDVAGGILRVGLARPEDQVSSLWSAEQRWVGRGPLEAIPVKGPVAGPPGPGYLVLGEDEAGRLRATPLSPQGGAEEVPVILPRPQEALLLSLVKLVVG